MKGKIHHLNVRDYMDDEGCDFTTEISKRFLKNWDESFCTSGAIILNGHGITNELVNRLVGETSKWFNDTTIHEKLSYNHGYYGHPNGGYTGVYQESVASSIEGKKGNDKVDSVESFVFNGLPSNFVLPDGSTDSDAIFPSAQDYLKKIQKLRKVVHRLARESLGIADPLCFDSLYQDEGHKDALRFAYYPPNTNSGKVIDDDDDDDDRSNSNNSRSLRYGAHTDYQDITILKPDYGDWSIYESEYESDGEGEYVSTTGGLQILSRDCDMSDEDAWVPVHIHHSEDDPLVDVPLVINLGDFWNIWSAGRWLAPIHRVTNDGWKVRKSNMSMNMNKKQLPTLSVSRVARQSIVYFSIPLASAMIEPLKGIHIEGNAYLASTQYKPLNAGQHLQAKIERSNA
jgi:isopenicillin N synthase-like dioxygenase